MMIAMKKDWWKLLAVVLLVYTVIGGFIMEVPRLAIIYESIRGLYFHVPMWFTMMVMFLVSVVIAANAKMAYTELSRAHCSRLFNELRRIKYAR